MNVMFWSLLRVVALMLGWLSVVAAFFFILIRVSRASKRDGEGWVFIKTVFVFTLILSCVAAMAFLARQMLGV